MWTFTIPYEIPSQNAFRGAKWFSIKKEVDRIYFLIRHYTAQIKIPEPTGKRRLLLTAYRTKKCTDKANLVGGAKYLVDAIVRAKLLIDDNDDMVDIIYEQKVLSELPPELIRHFSRRPLTKITISEAVK